MCVRVCAYARVCVCACVSLAYPAARCTVSLRTQCVQRSGHTEEKEGEKRSILQEGHSTHDRKTARHMSEQYSCTTSLSCRNSA